MEGNSHMQFNDIAVFLGRGRMISMANIQIVQPLLTQLHVIPLLLQTPSRKVSGWQSLDEEYLRPLFSFALDSVRPKWQL